MNRIQKALKIIHTSKLIGFNNVLSVFTYRLKIKSGLVKIFQPVKVLKPSSAYFIEKATANSFTFDLADQTIQDAEQLCSGRLCYYSSEWVQQSDPPNWFIDPLVGNELDSAHKHWSDIDDFDTGGIDIKNVWEASRFTWVVTLALAYRMTSDAKYLNKLNAWLEDWISKNPINQGPNWKCGQEASIRVMNLALAAVILDQAKDTSAGLRDLVEAHLQRINPTIRYAMAQDNNHGTSEAAALFIGGSWLSGLGVASGYRWERIGRHLLENRAQRLIGKQGSFSQYSLNYHRVLLDTLCIAEVWRRHLQHPVFADKVVSQTKLATEWLRQMINPINGNGPNVGANDGARLLQWTNTPYRDYRPSVQLASVLFAGKRAFNAGPWDAPLQWLGIALPKAVATTLGNFVADDGGFAVLRHGQTMVMLRYPRFEFRPSQADALHLDLWLGGLNLLRDAGTYSYNTDNRSLSYFGGTESHNTVQFDDRDQMPRLSRFLFGDWLKTDSIESLASDLKSSRFMAGYTDSYGSTHRRRISLRKDGLTVEDELDGIANKAVLRWRLCPGDWRAMTGPGVLMLRNDEIGVQLLVKSSVPIARAELVEGWESRHYREKTSLPVVEIEVHTSATLVTELHWAA